MACPCRGSTAARRSGCSTRWDGRGKGTGPSVARGVAGVADGTRLSIDFVHFPAFAKYGELLRQQWGAVGVGLTLRPLEPATFAPAVFKDRSLRHQRHLVLQWPGPGDRRAPHVPLLADRSGAVHERRRLSAILRSTRLFDEAGRTVEREKRSRFYRQIQEIAVQQLPYFWLVETVSTRAWPARCAGFKPWTGLFAEAASCKR